VGGLCVGGGGGGGGGGVGLLWGGGGGGGGRVTGGESFCNRRTLAHTPVRETKVSKTGTVRPVNSAFDCLPLHPATNMFMHHNCTCSRRNFTVCDSKALAVFLVDFRLCSHPSNNSRPVARLLLYVEHQPRWSAARDDWQIECMQTGETDGSGGT